MPLNIHTHIQQQKNKNKNKNKNTKKTNKKNKKKTKKPPKQTKANKTIYKKHVHLLRSTISLKSPRSPEQKHDALKKIV